MNLLLTNGTATRAARVLAYSRDDLRVPALLAKASVSALGTITDAYLDGERVRLEPRADGGWQVAITY